MIDGKLEEKAEFARGRSHVYGFLSTMFREEITAERLRQIKEPDIQEILSEMGVQYNIFDQTDQDELLENLAVEYARLFLGPAKHISAHESIHHQRDDGDWGMHWGGSTVDVKKFIETAGLEYKPEYPGMPDHISVELEFMQESAKCEAQALQAQDLEGVLYCLRIERKFVQDHLIKWIPEFCDKIMSAAEISFYDGIARLTKQFILSELEEIDNTISTIEDMAASSQKLH